MEKLKFFQWFLFNTVTTELFKGEKEEREWKLVGPSSCTLHIHILVLISFCKQENNGYEDLNNLPKVTQQEKKKCHFVSDLCLYDIRTGSKNFAF